MNKSASAQSSQSDDEKDMPMKNGAQEDSSEEEQSQELTDENQSRLKNKKSATNNNDEEPEEEAYDVEKVVNHRVRYKKLQFYLKWEGWADDDNTWEDFENLNCPEKILEYRNKVLSDSQLDVLSLVSSGQRENIKEIFKDDPSVYDSITFRPSKTYNKAKKNLLYSKKKSLREKKKDKIMPKKLSKIPNFEVISPDFQTSNPLLKIEGVTIKNGEIFYKVKRRRLPSEEVSSKVLKETYPESLLSFLNELFTGNQ